MSTQVQNMFARIAGRYDRGNDILSMGIHHAWRRRTVRESIAAEGMSVLDCATGTGDLAIEFKRRVGATGSVIGTDFCREMLDFAPGKARAQKLDVRFEIADAMDLQYKDNSFDIASIAFGIRNVDSAEQCLRELARVVRPGGQVVVLEFGQPHGWFRFPYAAYSKLILPFLGRIVSGDRDAYEYLHDTSSRFPCREDFLAMMDGTGAYASSRWVELSFGIAYIYFGTVR